MSEEELLSLPEEPEDHESELRQDGRNAGQALAYVESGKSEMDTSRCRACEDAYGSVDSAADELDGMESSIDSHADNLVEWQDWGAAWKEEAISLINKYEPSRLEDLNLPSVSTSSTPASKDLARLNKEPGRIACASCGSELKEPWTGLKHCPICEP